MPSFEIADCPTSLPLTEAAEAGGRVQQGTLTLTVRNSTDRARTGRIAIEPQGRAKPDWFSFAGAPPTSPREMEHDFTAKGSETVRLNVKVPAGEAPGSHVFRMRVVAEEAPDEDFTVGPNVGFDVKAWSPAPAPPREPFPWWAIAVAAVMVLVIGGAAAYLLLGPRVPKLVGMPRNEAEIFLKGAGLDFTSTLVIVGGVSKSKDRVVLTVPPEGERLSQGSSIRLFIGAPTNLFQCPVPNGCVFATNLPVEAQKAIQANMAQIERSP